MASTSNETKISRSLYTMREQGAMTASLLIQFHSDEDRDEFTHDSFDKSGDMDSMPVAFGEFDLEDLESLENDSRIELVEPNAQFQIPEDPSEPQ